MRILILGGTRFLGPHIVHRAREAGHDVTLFNRGETAPDAFPELERLRGDRDDGDVGALANGAWDAAIDTSAYFPRAVDDALEALAGRVDHYLLVSSTSVYEEFDPDGYDEDAPLKELEDPSVEEVTPNTYGGLKVLCERASEKFDGRRTVFRPGLVAGPGDHTDRFTYWPVRIDRGGDVLVPGTPDDPIQYVDVRDLADFVVRTVEEQIEGTFNLVTPRGAHDMGELTRLCTDAGRAPAQLVWVDAEFLHEHEVKAWSDLPLWVPPDSPLGGIPHAVSTRAVEAGLTCRPLRETVEDVLQWFRTERADDALEAGISPDRERELLEGWASSV